MIEFLVLILYRRLFQKNNNNQEKNCVGIYV